jgi:HemY protein
MLWSLVKIILFVCLVAAAAFGAVALLEADGGLQIQFGGTEYLLGPLETVIALIVLVLIVWFFLKLVALFTAVWKFFNGDETALSRYFERNRQSKGYDALAEGMMALASGEGRTAMAKAAKAEKYLNKPELTNLLTAQAAELSGDRKKAEETYRKLVEVDATRFVGVRGILKQKLASGDTAMALKLAEKAFALNPKHEDTQDVLLKLQTQSKDWNGARETLNAKLKHCSLPRDVHKRRDAVLALSEARKVFDADQAIEAREAAIEANRLSPDLIPAAVMAAHSYIEQDQKKYATRVIQKAWDVSPHPDLAVAYAAVEPDETPKARLKRFKALTKIHMNHPESKMLMSELHMANENFPEARRALGDVYETDPTARSATLMAAIERGEGAGDHVVKGWLTSALSLPRGPQWICDSCQHIHAKWGPTCGNCESFDTLSWKAPPKSEVSLPSGLQMLPLMVGAADEASTDITVVDAVEIVEP